MRKRELRARIDELEEQLRVTVRQAHYAEMVCYWAGEMLDPASKYVLEQRRGRLQTAYEQWKTEVPHVPWRGVFFPGEWICEPGDWPSMEWMDADGYWHLLDKDDKEA